MGIHLGTNLTALEAVGEGKVLEKITALLEEYEGNTIACYEIEHVHNSVDVRILFKQVSEISSWFKYRAFQYSMRFGHIEDRLQDALEYNVGINEFQMEYFLKLRQFYLENNPSDLGGGETNED